MNKHVAFLLFLMSFHLLHQVKSLTSGGLQMWGKRQQEVCITVFLHCCVNLRSSISSLKTERDCKRCERVEVKLSNEIHILTEFPAYDRLRMLYFSLQ